jgi:hypothetical protein
MCGQRTPDIPLSVLFLRDFLPKYVCTERGRFLNTLHYLPMQLSRDDFFKLKGFKPFLKYAVIQYVHKVGVLFKKKLLSLRFFLNFEK